jgi:ParB family transcriptional regulator, chromosome partitioning protein
MLAEASVEIRSLSSLRPNPLNPRGAVGPADVADLVESIKQQGVLQPLVVTPEGLVLIGHRRLAAAKIAGLSEVPVVIRVANTPIEQIALALAENLQRQDITPIQEAHAYQTLLDCGLARAEIVRLIGVSFSRVTDRLSLLKLGEEAQSAVDRGDLSVGAGVALTKVKDPEQRTTIARQAAEVRLPIPAVRQLVERAAKGHVARAKFTPEPSAPLAAKSGKTSIATRAVEALRVRGSVRLTRADLADVVGQACTHCGLVGYDVSCRECQVPWIALQIAETRS